MNFSVSNLVAGLLFGVFGIYFFRIGKKNVNLKVMLSGFALMAYPYFVENKYATWGIGVVLTLFSYLSLIYDK